MEFPKEIGCWSISKAMDTYAYYKYNQYIAYISSNKIMVGSIRPIGVGFLNKETSSLDESIEILGRITDADSAKSEQ